MYTRACIEFYDYCVFFFFSSLQIFYEKLKILPLERKKKQNRLTNSIKLNTLCIILLWCTLAVAPRANTSTYGTAMNSSVCIMRVCVEWRAPYHVGVDTTGEQKPARTRPRQCPRPSTGTGACRLAPTRLHLLFPTNEPRHVSSFTYFPLRTYT